MSDIYWRDDACPINCMFLKQGYKCFVCSKYNGSLITGSDGAPTASPRCEIIKIRKEQGHTPQYKDE